MSLDAGDYRPRDAGNAVLYRVIDEHLEAFLESARRHADGAALPDFVAQEFRDFLTCGVLAHGFARLRCTVCALDRLVPFSCKGRGFCPSCGGRRMTESAARLVDDVLPRVPVRQWVLSLPYRLRYLLAWDHALARAVLGVYVRVLLGFQRDRARRYGIRDGRSGSVTVIQRFGGGLNLNLHYHTLLFDGVFFADGTNGALEFRPLPPPTDEEVGVVLARIAPRVQRLLKRRGLDPGNADALQADPVVEESAVLAGISSASIQAASRSGLVRGRACGAWGPIPTRPGCSRRRRDTRTSAASICTPTSMCRPRIARGWNACAVICSGRRWRKTGSRRHDDGRIVLTLKTAWTDGTRQLMFEPLELLEKLAALIPRPRINMVLYHGVLAPHATWRERVVASGAAPVAEAPRASHAYPEATDAPTTAPTGRHWAWADLMRRAFDIDVLACPRCGGRLRLIATVEDPDAIRAILVAMAGSRELAGRAPPFGSEMHPSHATAVGA